MRFTPDYNVVYKGVLYEADETFEIDEADADEMRQHGEIEVGPDAPAEEQGLVGPAPEKPRRGRPSKKEESK